MAERDRRGPIAHPEVGVVVAAAVLLRLPTVLSRAPLNYDDGAYLASVGAMRDGGLPFRDVFSSQGPAFLPLLWLADLVGGRVVWAPRLLPLLAGAALVVVVHRLALRAGDRAGAALAAVLVATSGSLLFTTGRLASDGVAAALGAAAVLAAAMARGRRGHLLTAVLLGLAVSVKSLFVLPAALAALWLVARRHGWRTAGALGAGSAAVLVLVAVPWGLAAVWDQYVGLHLDARSRPDLGDNADLAREVLWARERLLVVSALIAALVAAGAAVTPGRTRLGGGAPARDLAIAVWIWLVASMAIVLGHDPLLFQHLTLVVAPAAVLVARHRPPLLLAAAVLVVLLPGHAHRTGWRTTTAERSAADAAAIDLLRRIEPAGGRVISDEPALPRWAGRTSPGSMVDPSFVRIEAGHLTTADVVAAAAEPGVCAVVFWTGRLDHLPDLRARLPDHRPVFLSGRRAILLRDDCALGDAHGEAERR